MKLNYIWSAALFVLLATGCGSKYPQNFGANIDTSPELVDMGRATFNKLCASCHNFGKDGIGPDLSGLTRSVDKEWIRNFVRDPKAMIQAKDPRAMELYEKYKVYMQSFPDLSEREMENVISYLHTFIRRDSLEIELPVPPIKDPIPDTIAPSGLVVKLKLIGQVPASHEGSPKARINKMECEIRSGRIFINDLRGTLYELKNGEFHAFLSLNAYMDKFIHQPGLGTGFGSFAFHPDFHRNGLFYTTHTESVETDESDFTYGEGIDRALQWIVTEWKSDATSANSFSGTHRELIRADFVSGVHGMQEITFKPDIVPEDPDYGMLYIAIGDGGAVDKGFPHIADHQGKKIWGSILRVDPAGRNSVNGKYGVPADNPFIGKTGMCGEVWAYGFRNPNRLAWDATGRLLATDIGQSNIEEINSIEAGKFYGWPIREGTFLIDPNGKLAHIYPLPDNDDDLNAEYPLVQYDHDESTAIIGGYVTKDGIFDGQYIFGDIVTGRLFHSDISGNGPIKIEEWNLFYENRAVDLYGLTGSSRVDLRFGKDCEENIYILTKADGRVYKLVGRVSI